MGNAQSFDFYIYSRPDGERRFTLTDLAEAGRKNRRIHDALSKILSASDKITSTAAQRQERKNIL